MIEFAEYVFANPNVPIVVGRSVIDTLTVFLCGGTGIDLNFIRPNSPNSSASVATSSSPSNQEPTLDPVEKGWLNTGEEYFRREGGEEKREQVVDGIIALGSSARTAGDGMREGGWVDECVSPTLLSLPRLRSALVFRSGLVLHRILLLETENNLEVYIGPHPRTRRGFPASRYDSEYDSQWFLRGWKSVR